MKSTLKFIALFLILSLISCKDQLQSVEIDEPEPVFIKYVKKEYLKQDTLHSYIKKTSTTSRPENLGKPFDTLQFNKVIAYDYEGSEEPYPSIIEEGDFNPVVLKQQALTKSQMSKLVKCLTTTSSYGEQSASCFRPHLGILFFNENKIVYTVDICLDCNGIYSSSDIPAIEAIKVEYPFGFSATGKKDIINLCTELDFYYGSKKYLKE